ncbi:hypothetical protein MMC20_004913 [Loxospora ochrophaea]|nr:hypothetical protein [Loxospora ochrophaea]
MALVSRDGSNQVLQQQGSVDWTRISTASLTFSVDILTRLSGAGLEPWTVTVAQIVCGSTLPIGVHGGQRLVESLKSLRAFTGIGDAIWYGVGVRHVIRQIVTTSEGASCVGFIGCLAECHDPSYCAHVLYCMSKACKSPDALTPSFSQWKQLVRTCSGIFANSTFGLKVQRFLTLAGFSASALDSVPNTPAANPDSLARVLCVIGTVQQNKIKSITVAGGPECCWLAVLCEFLLNLKVLFQMQDSIILFQNYSSGTPQVRFQVRGAHDNGSQLTDSRDIECLTKVYHLDSLEFLSCWDARWNSNSVGRIEPGLDETISRQTLGARLEWSSLIRDFSGAKMEPILCLNNPARTCFIEMLAAAAVLVTDGLGSCRYHSPQSYVDSVISLWPELSGLQDIFGEISTFQWDCNQEAAASNFEAAKSRLFESMTSTHRGFVTAMCELIIALPYLFDELIFDIHLRPTRSGLQWLLSNMLAEPRIRGLSSSSKRSDRLRRRLTLYQLTTRSINQTLFARFDTILRLFSGYNGELEQILLFSEDFCSAMSFNGFYCYSNVLTNLSDRYHLSSKIHVGIGQIQTQLRTYSILYDIEHTLSRSAWSMSCLTKTVYTGAVPVHIIEGDVFWKVESVIEESQSSSLLRSALCVSSSQRQLFVSPAEFVNLLLPAAIKWKIFSRPQALPHEADATLRVLGRTSECNPGANRSPVSSRPHLELSRCLIVYECLGRCNLLDTLEDLPAFVQSILMDVGRSKMGSGFEHLEHEEKVSALEAWFRKWTVRDSGFCDPAFYTLDRAEYFSPTYV